MNTFIRVAEVWHPSVDGSLLEPAGGAYGAAPAFGTMTRSMCFGRGEGLPGRAWDEGRPVMLRELSGSGFRRTEAARSAGLRCAVALPVFADETLSSIVVLFCGDAAEQIGAVELWRNDPRIGTDLTLADGFFGSTGPELESLSRDGGLARGAGAPGLAWQKEAAVFIDNIAQGERRFLRAQVAASLGIVRALAIPCSVRVRETWVLSLLSSAGTPIAHRVESWLPGEGAGGPRRAFGHCEHAGRLATAADGAADEPPTAVLQSLRSGAAQAAMVTVPGTTLESVLTIPVLGDGAVSEVLALYF